MLVGISSLFLLIFISASSFMFAFPMVGFLDVVYFPSQVAITAVILSVFFAILVRKNLFGKLILVINTLVLFIMIFFGP